MTRDLSTARIPSITSISRLTDTSGPQGTLHYGADSVGRTTTATLDGTVVATPAYAAPDGELSGVVYGNATNLATITRDQSDRTTALSFTQTGGAALVTDSVNRSQSGRVIDESIDGTDANTASGDAGANFRYDPAGRLIEAWVPTQHLVYGFAPSGGCGVMASAGKNSNRTSVTLNGGTPTTYCYDNADRLTSSSDAGVGTPVYDAHGNTTALGTQTLGYDPADRHVSTTAGSSTVTYTRDATDRMISRTEAGVATGYGFTGPGDSPAFTTGALGVVVDRFVSLPGGVSLTKRTTGDVWSYPNIHGDVVATANAAGVKQGVTLSYDPYGTALGTPPDNATGNFDYAWLGQHERGTEHAPAVTPTIEMGARPYVPSVGRFLETDPVVGGSANDYDYTNGDPVNGSDLTGTCGWFGNPTHRCRDTIVPSQPFNPYGCSVKQDFVHRSSHQPGTIGATIRVDCSVPVFIGIKGKVSRSSWRGYQDFATDMGNNGGMTTAFDLNVYDACRLGSTYDYKSEVDIFVSGPLGDWGALLQTPHQRLKCLR